MKLNQLCVAIILVVCAFPVLSEERVDHFSGKPSKTLAEAVTNFNQGNKELRKLLEGEVTLSDLDKIHQLSYTLENALGKINQEAKALAILLEQIHLGSETGKTVAVKGNSKAYFDIVDKLELGK